MPLGASALSRLCTTPETWGKTVGVDETTGGVNWLELIDSANGLQLEAKAVNLTCPS